MTSPNFLSHIGSSGFVQQPGIGDVLGQQFQNIAQTRGIVREQNQRQQQIDQLGQYYQGQVEEMSRLRDQQEMAARMAQQRAIQRQQILSRHPPAENETPEQAVQRLKLMLPDLVQIGDESVGSIVELLKSMGGDKPTQLIQRDPTKALVNPITGEEISPAAPAPAGKRVERTVDLGNQVEYIYTDGTRETKPKGRIPGAGGDGGLTPSQSMLEENRLTDDYRQETREITKALRQFGQTDDAVVQAAVNRDPAAQFRVLYTFINTMDNTAVREGEQALVRSSESLINRARNALGKASGESVTISADMVRSMAAILRKVQGNLTSERKRIRNYYINRAKRSKLSDPVGLFPEDPDAESNEDNAGAAAVDKLLKDVP